MILRREQVVQDQLRLDASAAGWRVWRNNVGVAFDAKGKPVRYGLANDSRAVNAVTKSSDLIGIRPVSVTAEHVGTVIGQFVAIEVKRDGWRYAGTEREIAQFNYLSIVGSLGGYAKFSTGEL